MVEAVIDFFLKGFLITATALRNMSLSQKENQTINQPMRYCWWKKSGDHQLIDSLYHYLHGFSYISAGFFPDFFHQQYWYRWDKAFFQSTCKGASGRNCEVSCPISLGIQLGRSFREFNSPWICRLQIRKKPLNLTIMTNKKIIQWHWTKYTLEMITRHIRLKTSWKKLFTDGIEKNSHGYVGIYWIYKWP